MTRSFLLPAAAAAATALLLLLTISSLPSSVEAYPCPAGTQIFNCFVDPCQGVSTCPLGCQSDYCGGCNARCRCRRDRDCTQAGGGKCVFDKAGDRFGVCDSRAPPKPTPVKACKKPCTAGQECRDGLCQPSCAVIRCASGYTCSNGQCVANPPPPATDCSLVLCQEGTTCTDGVCNPIAPQCGGQTCQSYEQCENGACVDPTCAAVTCLEGSQCRNGVCGPSTNPPPAEPTCANVKCAAGTFCDTAVQCRPSGTCATPKDCAQDPDFVHVMCTGSFTCEAGQCGYQCDAGGAF